MTRGSRVVVGEMGLKQTTSAAAIFMLLLSPHVLPAAYSAQCPCAASGLRTDAAGRLEEHLTNTTTWMFELNCCARHLLAAHHPKHTQNDSFNIVWSFKGEEYKEVDGRAMWSRKVSTFRAAFCGMQSLQSDSLTLRDEGVYSCRVTSPSGASVTKTFSLCLNRNEDTGSRPLNSTISEDTPALLRQTVTFSCSAFVGWPRCERNREEYGLTWTKERPDGSWVKASQLSHSEITTTGVEKGVMKSSLTVHSVQKEHFGHYRCTVTNHSGNLTLNVTLTKGVTFLMRVTGEYRAALLVMSAATVVLVAALVLWRRCQVRLSLHLRHNKAASSTDGHQYDVFLVHGDSASRWVWSVLLPALEDSLGYSCFLPQRDMCGGSLIIEEVADVVFSCRCVVVVVSPCLLENPWAAWALHNAVKAALQARTRLLALLLQISPFLGISIFTNSIGFHLLSLTNLSCSCVDSKPKEDLSHDDPPKKETQFHDPKNSLKTLSVTDAMGCRSRSKSPMNLRLSNMITGSSMDCRDTTKDKKEPKSPGKVIFLERQDSEDPGSPCSETPFILPSTVTIQKNRHTMAWAKNKLCTFLSVLCSRAQQQEEFWYRLQSWLGPPATAKPHEDIVNKDPKLSRPPCVQLKTHE
ncbi:Interleukin-1 receptor accessory protein-like 1-A [Chionoecetes opilio]|uniref:Soluble interferon alpha/beta receptor OPG204 n=1 Tax=Chionoecetes opilio TaxID=41210 RepID=A0A8J5D5B8_CHIOP|nr:Interleukin-1 receptor accessory protein-like 1-A [Chionoecetes opilio]